jgi:hypothetical protein
MNNLPLTRMDVCQKFVSWADIDDGVSPKESTLYALYKGIFHFRRKFFSPMTNFADDEFRRFHFRRKIFSPKIFFADSNIAEIIYDRKVIRI